MVERTRECADAIWWWWSKAIRLASKTVLLFCLSKPLAPVNTHEHSKILITLFTTRVIWITEAIPAIVCPCMSCCLKTRWRLDISKARLKADVSSAGPTAHGVVAYGALACHGLCWGLAYRPGSSGGYSGDVLSGQNDFPEHVDVIRWYDRTSASFC